MKKIPLSQGKFALVDDDDFAWLMQWKWYTATNGYAVRSVQKDNKRWQLYMHREIVGVNSQIQIDHISGNKLDNRRDNLRLATNRENTRNSCLKSNNTSGYKGVTWHKKAQKYMVQIWKDYKKYYVGLFNTPEEAALAYNKAALELHGEFAKLNEVSLCK